MRALPRPRRPWDRTPVGEREYFDLLGPGLVAVLPPRRPEESATEGWRPPTGGAWVHIGTDGRVRAFTGKAEVGQGTRTALALVVAEELRVSLDQVEIVMGDTDVCPWDMGTFGSRSMPDGASALGVVAAGARESLVALAAARAGRDSSEFMALGGEVRPRKGTEGIAYGMLVHGSNRVVTVRSDLALTPAPERQRVGRPTIDAATEEVVSGRRAYGSDIRRPGMMYGAVLHPPRYGAKLVRLESGSTVRSDGATVVREDDFVGVVAASPAAARSALGDLHPEWSEVASPGEAEIEEHLRAHPGEAEGWDKDEYSAGDCASALAAAPVRLTATYRTAYLAHVPLETRCAVAEWDGTRLTAWVGTQTPFRARDDVAEALGIPVETVRVIVPPTGSGFGGKHGANLAIAAARLARAVQRPVRVSFSREEEFRFAYFRPMSLVDVAVGGGRDGRLSAWKFHNVNGGSAALYPPYRVPNQKVDNELSESPLPQGSYRALAATANNFARETALDEFAHAVDIDPLEIRERNLSDERLRTVVRRVAERAGWASRGHRPGHGYGLAAGLEKNSRVATVAEVTTDAEGDVRVVRLVTAFEAGSIVNPENLRSQVEGATVMALGGALFEAVHFDPGRIRNAGLLQYRVPRFSDLPDLDVELVDRPDLPPSGAGETPMIAVAPAVGNAIFDATGRRLRSLPLVPEGRLPPVDSA